MDEITRKNQIEKIDSLIKKQNVSRRDFFGTLGKIAVLSQVVALGAGGFLASCVAFEDKKTAGGILKDCSNFQCSPGVGVSETNFTCNNGQFVCKSSFTCIKTGVNTFICDPIKGGFACEDTWSCGGSYSHRGGV